MDARKMDEKVRYRYSLYLCIQVYIGTVLSWDYRSCQAYSHTPSHRLNHTVHSHKLYRICVLKLKINYLKIQAFVIKQKINLPLIQGIYL